MSRSRFVGGPDLKAFLLRQNKRAEAWIADNWERLRLDHPLDPGTISKTLNAKVVPTVVVNAFEELYRVVQEDPWAWCHPDGLENLQDVAGLGWWWTTLGLGDVIPFNSWQMMPRRGMSEEVANAAQERFDAWSVRLRAACDQYKADAALVRAYWADVRAREEGAVQEWVNVDGVLHRKKPWDSGASPIWKRKPPFGLHHLFAHSEIKTEASFVERAAMAKAMADMDLTLPDVARAALTYERPVPTQDDLDWAENEVALMIQSGFAEAVGRAWNGESWDFVRTHKEHRHALCRYVWDDAAWDYRTEVVDPLQKVWEPRRYTGQFIPAHIDEPPEDNRVWIAPRKYVVSERSAVGAAWHDVTKYADGFWAYPGETSPRHVEARFVGGEWVEGFWRDVEDHEREFKLTGLRRIEPKPADVVKAEFFDAYRARGMAEDDIAAWWDRSGAELVALHEAEVAGRDAEIAAKIAAISSSQPD